MPKPRVVVYIEGGLVQDIHMDSQVEVLLVDYDIIQDDGTRTIMDREALVSLWEGPSYADLVEQAFEEAGYVP